MNRMAFAVAAALLLPVVTLAAMIGQQEYSLAGATILNVPLRGFDPRDLLRGHYISVQLDWEWQDEPVANDGSRPGNGGLCVLSTDNGKPRVRFLAGWKPGDRSDSACRLVLAGHAWAGRGSLPARFAPTNLDDGSGGIRLFIAETRGAEFETMLRQRPGTLTVDLAVRADGSAAIKSLRADGQMIGR